MSKIFAKINFKNRARPTFTQSKRSNQKERKKYSCDFWPLVWALFKGGPNVKLEGKIGRDNLPSSPPTYLTHPSLEFNLFKLLFTLLYTNWSDYKPRSLMGMPRLSIVVELNFINVKLIMKTKKDSYIFVKDWAKIRINNNKRATL